jgi:hypothetical protein
MLDALGIRAPHGGAHRLRADKPVQTPFNASQLAPVKMVLQRPDDILVSGAYRTVGSA